MSATPKLRADKAFCFCQDVGAHVDIFNERNVPVAAACTVPLAESFVRAVNSHAALVAALEEIDIVINADGYQGNPPDRARQIEDVQAIVDDALRLVRGES